MVGVVYLVVLVVCVSCGFLVGSLCAGGVCVWWAVVL